MMNSTEESESKFKQSEPRTAREDTRVAVIGNVDSGKSTLVGVLTRGVVDDGRGSARRLVFNFSHEEANGRTSSIGQEIMGFDSGGSQVTPERLTENKNKSWSYVANHSQKLVTFLDLCGHERYLKTTVFGLVGLMPDYAMIVVGANMGVTRMTREHIGLALSMKIPMFFVVTKVDIAPDNVYKKTLETLQKILRSPGAGNRMPLLVDSQSEFGEMAEMIETKLCPIFRISNVTSEGLEELKKFVHCLKARTLNTGAFGSAEEPVEFLIDGVFLVTGVGVVVSGIMKAGTVQLNQSLCLGPDKSGNYRTVTVRGIHIKRTNAEEARAGQSACFNIRAANKKEQLKKNQIKKGMVVVDRSLTPETAWEFEAKVVILHHGTTIRANYQPIIHCGVVRQAARVVWMSSGLLRTGDEGTLRFRFMFRPELIHRGMKILFREGRTKGLGEIFKVYPI